MNMEVGGSARIGAQQTEVSGAGRLGSRAVEPGQAQRSRVGSGSGGFFRGVKSLASRVLDSVTPSGVRVQSKAARADAALGRGIDRAVSALRKGGADGVQAFRAELLALRKGERALGRGGIDYDATLQQGLRNRFAAMSDSELRGIMGSVRSDALGAVRNELIDGPPREVQALNDALVDAGLSQGLSSDELARPDALRDLSLFESLALDESVRRTDARGVANIDRALEQALGEVGREAGGVRGAVAFVLPTACEAARHAVAELRRDGAIPESGTPEATEQADAARTFGLVKQRLEAMGGETRAVLLRYADSRQLQQLAGGTPIADARTPETDAAIRAEIPQREARLTRSLERLVGGLEQRGVPDADSAARFVRDLGEAVSTLRELRGHVATFGLDGARAEALGERLKAHVATVPPDALALEARTDREIGSLAGALRRLGAEHLYGALGGVIAERNAAAREAYAGHFDVFLASITNAREGGLPDAMRALQQSAQHVLDLANALGAGIEGQDQVSPFRGELLEQTIAGYESDDLLAALGQMRSPEFVSATRALEDAGADLSFMTRTTDLGRELLNHGVFLGLIAEQLATELEGRGVEVPAEPEIVAGGRPGALAQELLRGLGGLQMSDSGQVSFAGSAQPAAASRDFSIDGSAVRLLDTVAGSNFDAARLLEQGFIFNHVLLSAMSQQGGIDADERQGQREAVFQRLLAGASDAQLANLHESLNSPEMQTFLGTANVIRFDSTPLPEAELYARGRLVASTESLDVLRVLAGEQMAQRGLPTGQQARIDITSLEQVPAEYMQAFDRAVDNILRLGSVEVVARDNQPVSDNFRDIFTDMFVVAPTSTQRDPSADGLPGVAGAFSADVGRATMTVTRQGETVELYDRATQALPENEKQARRADAVERLKTFCGGDPALTLGLSRYMNQAALAPAEQALMLSDMRIPGTDLPLGMLVRDGGQVRFDAEHLGDTRYRIDYSVGWRLIGTQSDEGMIALDPTRSRLSVSFSATLDFADPDQPVIALGDVRHDLHVSRGMSFDVG